MAAVLFFDKPGAGEHVGHWRMARVVGGRWVVCDAGGEQLSETVPAGGWCGVVIKPEAVARAVVASESEGFLFCTKKQTRKLIFIF